MSRKQRAFSPWAFAAVTAAFGIVFGFAACGNGTPPPTGSEDNPKKLSPKINLGNGEWGQLLTEIEAEGKYVSLDLSDCTMSGTVFDSGNTITTGKDKIVKIVLPVSAESIASNYSNQTLSSFPNLKEVTGLNVTKLDDYAFYGCTSLRKAEFPAVTRIGNYAFRGCTSLTEISFSAAKDRYFYDQTFMGCTNLVKFNLTGTGDFSVIENGKVLVRDDTILVAYPSASGSIVMDNITAIGVTAFAGCVNLTKASFPALARNDGLNSDIYDGAFTGCTGLMEISFPASIEIDSYNPFYGCSSLTNFDLTGTGPLSVAENGKALIGGGTSYSKVLAYPSATGSIVMEGVTYLGSLAFSGCTGLIEASFPAAVNIGSETFFACANLTTVSLPSITRIDLGAFSGCTSLNSITLGTIDEAYFKNATSFLASLGNLRDVYFGAGGGAGTYTRESGSDTRSKQ
ncbi:MAG: leucine-rich repeat domain-containing protein [Treponema sp.]|jgi:hypothetical protein|nr:leucine-rich repeat domain-containing protein [Treponema sp.]